ncbi:hypothetical protein ACFQGT_00080 [Natrialbaceae archaeon GCM10025810]
MASRTQRVRGRVPPGLEGTGWQVRSVARRVTNSDETATCIVTGEPVALNEPHWFITLARETGYRWRPLAYEYLLVAFGALEEFEGLVRDGEE